MKGREYYVVRSKYNPDDIELCDSRPAVAEWMSDKTGEEWTEASLNYHFKGNKARAEYKGYVIYRKVLRISSKKKRKIKDQSKRLVKTHAGDSSRREKLKE